MSPTELERGVLLALERGPATVNELAGTLEARTEDIWLTLYRLADRREVWAGEWGRGASDSRPCVRQWHAGRHPKIWGGPGA